MSVQFTDLNRQFAVEVGQKDGNICLFITSIRDYSLNLCLQFSDDMVDRIAFHIGCELQEKEYAKNEINKKLETLNADDRA